MFEQLFIKNELQEKEITKLSETETTWLSQILGGVSTSSGQRITKEGALKISAVYACVNIRANTIAKMPLHVFKSVENGHVNVTNKISYLLNVRPNPYMTPFTFKQTLSAHIDLWGNAYILIKSKRGIPEELLILYPWETEIWKDPKTKKVWYRNDNKLYRNEEIIHLKALSLDGIKGRSRITAARETLGNVQAGQKLLGGFYKNGTTTKGVITYPEELSNPAKQNIRKQWEEINTGVENAGKVAILDLGLDFKNIGMSFEDAQFIQLNKFSVEEISRFFNVPPHMLAIMDGAKFNNVEQQDLNFIKNSIQPDLTNHEQEIAYKMFSYDDLLAGYYVKFNMSAAMRGDDKTRAEFYKIMLETGIYSINDCLRYEDKNTIGEIGEKHRVSLNFVDIEIAEKYQLLKAKGGKEDGENK